MYYYYLHFSRTSKVGMRNIENNMEDNMLPGPVSSKAHGFYLGTMDWSPLLKDKCIQEEV